MFEVSIDGNETIRLIGRLTAAEVDTATAVFNGIGQSCTVDCSELSYISSAGLGLLFAAQRRLVDAGKGLRLVNMNPHIREVFRIAGFDRIFEIE